MPAAWLAMRTALARSACPRLLDHARDVGKASLAVVGKHDRVEVGQRTLIVGELGREDLVRRQGLEVDAQQLLLTTDHTQLDRSRQGRVAVQRCMYPRG